MKTSDLSVMLVYLPVREEGAVRSRAVYPPLGIGYIAAVLKPKVKSVRILDARSLQQSVRDVADEIARAAPDVVGMTVFTIHEKSALALCRLVRQVSPSTKTILGGPHIFHLHDQIMAEHHDIVDFCVRGEGEVTAQELMAALAGDRDLADVDGLTYWSGDAVVVNKPRALIENLDTVPFPARDLMPNEVYKGIRVLGGGAGEFTSINVSRGCPYACKYCSSAAEWHRKVRFRSVDNVMAELIECRDKFGMKYLRINDDLFTMRDEWVKEFCEKYHANGLNFQWVCDARVETVNPKMLERMKRAGCIGIFFGIEFGNERIRRSAGKNFTNKKVEEAVKMANKAGIPSYGLFMLGYPGEDRSTVVETIEFATKLGLDWAGFCVVTPLPGTPLYDYCKENNMLKTTDWADYDFIDGRSVIRHDKLRDDEVPELHRLAFRRFYFRPGYILMRLLRIRSPLDVLFAAMTVSDLVRARLRRAAPDRSATEPAAHSSF